MFLAEFTVVIFFYTLLLHLRTAVQQRLVQITGVYYLIIPLLMFILYFTVFKSSIVPTTTESYLMVLNVYKLSNSLTTTDLIFF